MARVPPVVVPFELVKILLSPDKIAKRHCMGQVRWRPSHDSGEHSSCRVALIDHTAA